MIKHLILLHGLGRTSGSLRKIEKYFRAKGFTLINQGYNSRKYTIDEIVENDIKRIISNIKITPKDEVRFITHSLGGIVLLKYLEKHPIRNLKSIVLLAPPIKGSSVAEIFSRFPFSSFIIGKPLNELGTKSIVTTKIPTCEVGVIQGTKNMIPFFGIKEISDGLVTLQSTIHKDIKHYKSLPLTHTFMMNSDELIKYIDYFMTKGKFD
jgi:triacylglycerol lipase